MIKSYKSWKPTKLVFKYNVNDIIIIRKYCNRTKIFSINTMPIRKRNIYFSDFGASTTIKVDAIIYNMINSIKKDK